MKANKVVDASKFLGFCEQLFVCFAGARVFIAKLSTNALKIIERKKSINGNQSTPKRIMFNLFIVLKRQLYQFINYSSVTHAFVWMTKGFCEASLNRNFDLIR
jgi:hypothetical protein